MFFQRGAKVAPSHYPRFLFHGIRTVQLISSVIVGGIMSYFMYHLTHDHWTTPWTFIFLMAASLASVAALLFTILMHCCIGLNPRLNIAINSLLLVLWALSWSLLTWYMSGTLANVCDVEHWREDVGIMVCRIYKALFTFSLLGLLSTIAALVLDIYVRRQQTMRGVYRLHDIDSKGRPAAGNGPFTEGGYGQGGLGASRESSAWEEPRPSMGPYSERGAAEPMFENKGYAVPEDQFAYDTGYHGHGGPNARPYGS